MELFIFILFIDSWSCTEAGFFDAFGTFINRSPVEEPIKAFNPMYQMDTTKEVLDAGFNGNTDISYRQNTWGDPEVHDKSPIVQGFSDKTTSDDTSNDKNSAKLFPQGVKALTRLKELNTLKDERKIRIGDRGIGNRGIEIVSTSDLNKDVDVDNNEPNSYVGIDNNLMNKHVNVVKIPNKYAGNDVNNNVLTIGVNKSTNKSTVNNDDDRSHNMLKPLTKRHFFSQVQPVIPENEGQEKDTTETIYYVE